MTKYIDILSVMMGALCEGGLGKAMDMRMCR